MRNEFGRCHRRHQERKWQLLRFARHRNRQFGKNCQVHRDEFRVFSRSARIYNAILLYRVFVCARACLGRKRSEKAS